MGVLHSRPNSLLRHRTRKWPPKNCKKQCKLPFRHQSKNNKLRIGLSLSTQFTIFQRMVTITELLRMLGYLQCRRVIISHIRIGYVVNRDTKSARRPRHIKVEFKSPYEVSSVLNNAKYLKENKYYNGVNTSSGCLVKSWIM